MADPITTATLPAKEVVALELWKALRNINQTPDEQLRFFVTCRDAAYGVAPK